MTEKEREIFKRFLAEKLPREDSQHFRTLVSHLRRALPRDEARFRAYRAGLSPDEGAEEARSPSEEKG